jgi:uncharacterized protein (DUF169 family)
MSEWQVWGKLLQEALNLGRAPIAVTYSDAPPKGAAANRCRVCSAIYQASAGEVIDMTGETSACPGGSLYLGLRQQPPEQARTLRDFLINGEKLLSSPAAIHRMQAMSKVKPPFGLADHVVMSPLVTAELRPDIAIFFCNAWQAARIVNLGYYETGMPIECDPTGALCKAVITYPLVTGKVNVSFGDVTARKSERMSENELFVTLPYAHLRSVAWSVDKSTAGTAKGEIPQSMRRMVEDAGGEAPEL